MTLILWKAPVVDDPDEAKALLATWYKTGDDSAFEPSGDLTMVYDILLSKYPMDWEMGADPWADGPDNSGRLLVLSLRWGGDSRILEDVEALARKHQLVLYDPQGPDVFLPTDPVDGDPAPPMTFGDHAWIWAMFLGFAGLTIAAWHIPYGWLRWPLVIVGGFLTISAGIVVYATMFGRDEEQRA